MSESRAEGTRDRAREKSTYQREPALDLHHRDFSHLTDLNSEARRCWRHNAKFVFQQTSGRAAT